MLKNAIDSQNFIADADIRNEIRKELGLKDKFVVGHVGRLHPQKNHDFLIDVFAEIKKKKPDAELILVGTGPLEEKVKSKVVEKGLSDCVHFLGNRKDMNRIYQAMDVFVFHLCLKVWVLLQSKRRRRVFLLSALKDCRRKRILHQSTGNCC